MLRIPLGFLCLLAITGCEGFLAGSTWVPGEEPTSPPTPLVIPGLEPEPEVDVCLPESTDVGRVTLRRLNRFEYDSTVRDLLGDTTGPADAFPADDYGHGFDNQGDVLSTAPLLVEKYDAAALALVKAALAAEYQPGFSERLPATAMTSTTGSAAGAAWNLYSNGSLTGEVTVSIPGTYTLNVRAWEQAAGAERAQMAFLVNGVAQGTAVNVAATQASPQTYSRQVTLAVGTHRIGASFLNDYYLAPADRNLLVEWVELTRPATGTASSTARILTCDLLAGASCVNEILSRFGRKAWRRPLVSAELTRLSALVTLAQTQGDGVQQGLELALQAILLSPHFLFRVEADLSTTPRARRSRAGRAPLLFPLGLHP